MKFKCPQCGQPLEMESMYGGQTVQCPTCGIDLTAPAISQATPPEVIQALQSNIDRGSMTISQYMASQQIEGDIDIQGIEDKSSASAILIAEQGCKYELGNVVATGGMGAILGAKDLNVRRNVAMKVMLEPEKAGKEQILRFIQEAQVTGQLEHPSIVPLYELGVDASSNVFYTMKFVKGWTLKDILNRIREKDGKTIREYPLSHLLTIFQKVCDAIAFAHSKRVIHRDLKPENVMVGDYGEVQVMDWGLAKVLPKKRKTFAKAEGGNLRSEVRVQRAESSKNSFAGNAAIDSVRGDETGEILKTIDGSIMGTPGFMSPEQALGQTDEVDQRTDIYALGAILYNILTLEIPVQGKTLTEIIKKITSGEIKKPAEYNKGRGKGEEGRDQRSKVRIQNTKEPGTRNEEPAYSLPHCPDGQIPESLSAVVMKALDVDALKRYQTVKRLQNDIEAYQNGFVTGAEDAGAWKQFHFFIKRHKTLSMFATAFLVAVAAGTVVSTTQWIRAEKSKRALIEKERIASEALAELKNMAPALIAQAKAHIERSECEQALKIVSYATSLIPDNAEYWYLKGNILQTLLRLNEAEQAYDRALIIDADNRQAGENRDLCRILVGKNRGNKGLSMSLIGELHTAMINQHRYAEAIAMMRRLNPDVTTLEEFYRHLLSGKGIKYSGLSVDSKGLCSLDLARSGISDLSPLKGLPLIKVNLAYTKVRDLSPLQGMLLAFLDVGYTPVMDLSPLKQMPLKELNLSHTSVIDLAPLEGMELQKLNIASAPVTDLSPLKGMPLLELDITLCGITDPSLLKSMKTLEKLKGIEFLIFKNAIQYLTKDEWAHAEREAQKIIAEWQEVPAMRKNIQAANRIGDTLIPMRQKQMDVPVCAETYEGRHYLHCPFPLTWIEAKTFCESVGGHLLTITSRGKQEQVFKLLPDSCFMTWLGGSDLAKNGSWKWVTGEKWEYTNWAPGPKFGDSLALIDSDRWCTMSQGKDKLGFVIEWDR